MEKLVFEYICQDKYITNEYPINSSPENLNKYLAKEYNCQIYFNILNNTNSCPTLLFTGMIYYDEAE